ncbi:MAG TPA: hypothetical protein VFU76_16710 [Terriglobales bacterium]|nr:hypothetical protein [Terriglobales bacterium]
MGRIVFQPELPIAPPDPDRADVACFVGLVRLARSLVPDKVHRVSNGSADIDLAQLKRDDVVLVNVGEVVPVDGAVVSGQSLVDESPVTGVPGLIQKGAAGDAKVLAGSRNVTAQLTIKAGKDAAPVAPLPLSKRTWLRDNGWLEGPYARDCAALKDVPVPLSAYAEFQHLFDDGASNAAVGTDYLAAAVRSFFGQGGKRCYVVRMGDPVARDTAWVTRLNLAGQMLPGDSSAADQKSWTGVGHLFGLPDVSFLLLPDLPALHATAIQPAKPVEEVIPSGPEQFVPCVPEAKQPPKLTLRAFPAPRFSLDNYNSWGKTLRSLVQFLSSDRLREVQLVAAMPMPYNEGISTALQSPAQLASGVHEAIAAVLPEKPADTQNSASSEFLQLAYPWLRTAGSELLLQSLEPPDGTLAGLLARNALVRGTFTSAVKIPPQAIIDVQPPLPANETQIPAGKPVWGQDAEKPLVTRISLFGFTPQGIRLLSDVTTYPEEAYRPARVLRLRSVLRRAARRFGESHLFDQNGPRLWGEVEQTLRKLMTRLWDLGALDGPTPAAAFDVRCDRSTMTQSDLDNGRLVALVSFYAAAIVELIQVLLTVQVGSTSEAEIQAQLIGAP